jgi:hypothetical protein
MIRTQISLTESQYRYLKEASRESGVSLSSLVREAVSGLMRSQRESRRQALEILGSFVADRDDVSVRHDEYLHGGEE